MSDEKKYRNILVAPAYLQDAFQALDHFAGVELVNQEYHDDTKEHGYWDIKFHCTDEVMLDCIRWWWAKLNWEPLKIGLYIV